jgi:hypothetical protein
MKSKEHNNNNDQYYQELEEYEFLRKSIRPCSIHCNPGMKFGDYDTATSYARGRAYQILSGRGYRTIIPGKYLPAFDLIHYCELVPYTVDLYALQYHPESKNVVTDELVVDIRRKTHDGLTIVPYDMNTTIGSSVSAASASSTSPMTPKQRKAFVEHANQYKKQMICSHYDIDPKRYVIMDEDELFSRRYARPTAEIEKILFADRCDTMIKSKDDLYVELPV